MMNLELLSILFLLNILERYSSPKTNLKFSMDLGELVMWLGCSFYMVLWVVIANKSNWWLIEEPTMSIGAPFRLNTYMPSIRFEGIIASLHYTYQKDVSSTCAKWKKNGTLTWLKSLIHNGLMYLTKVLYSGLTNMYSHLCVLGVNIIFCNKRHTICCDFFFILSRDQIVEGKDFP